MLLGLVLSVFVLVFVWFLVARRNRKPLWEGGAPRVEGDAVIPYIGSGLSFTKDPEGFFVKGHAQANGSAFSFTRFGMSWTALADLNDLEVMERNRVLDFNAAYQHFLGPVWPTIFPFVDRQALFALLLTHSNTLKQVIRSLSAYIIQNDPFVSKEPVDLFDVIYRIAFRAHAQAFIGPGILLRLEEFEGKYFKANPENAMFSAVETVRMMLFGMDRPFQDVINVLLDILGAEIDGAGGDDQYAVTDASSTVMRCFFSQMHKNGLPAGSVGDIRSNTAACVWSTLMASIVNTAATASWALLYLSRAPEFLQRLRVEVAKVVGDKPPSEWDFDAVTLHAMPLMKVF
jgi:hypothetical protein